MSGKTMSFDMSRPLQKNESEHIHQQKSPGGVQNEDTEVIRLQHQLAHRLLLIFLVPFMIIFLLAIYSWRLSSRIKEVELIERVSHAEQLWLKSKNFDWAIAEYKALAEEYARPEILVRLGALYFEIGDRKSAFETLQKARNLDERGWEIYSTLTYMYLSEQKKREAVEAGEIALKLNPRDAQTYNNLAWIYATSEQHEFHNPVKAKEYALKSVQLTRGRDPNYLDTLAESYFRAGESDQALRTIRDAMANEFGRTRYLEEQLNRFQGRIAAQAKNEE